MEFERIICFVVLVICMLLALWGIGEGGEKGLKAVVGALVVGALIIIMPI